MAKQHNRRSRAGGSSRLQPAHRAAKRATSFTQTNTSNGTITINVNGPANFQLAVYALDWDYYTSGVNGRDITLSVGADSQEMDNGPSANPNHDYNNGTWVRFNVFDPTGAPVVLSMHQNNGTNVSNATLSAIAFDPVPEPTSLGFIAVAFGGLPARRRRH